MINLFEEKADLLENEMNYEVEALAPVALAPAAIVIIAAIVIVCWPLPTR